MSQTWDGVSCLGLLLLIFVKAKLATKLLTSEAGGFRCFGISLGGLVESKMTHLRRMSRVQLTSGRKEVHSMRTGQHDVMGLKSRCTIHPL